MKILPNLSFSRLMKSSDLIERVIFTFLILIVYRFLTFIPLPGINYTEFSLTLEYSSSIILNAFAGGGYERGSIAALGVGPYITASLLIHVLTLTGDLEFLNKLKKEGAFGNAQIKKYTKFLTVLFCIPTGLIILNTIYNSSIHCISINKHLFYVSGIISFTMTTLFLVWIGDQLGERGIGNGISVIIYLGVLMSGSSSILQLIEFSRNGLYTGTEILIYISCVFFIMYCVAFVENSFRKLSLIYPRRSVGKFALPASNTVLPIKINTAGIMPIIFASILLMSISGILQGIDLLIKKFTVKDAEFLLHYFGQYFHILNIIFIFCSTIIYCSMLFAPQDVADRLRKDGGYIAGIAPGDDTAKYLDTIVFKLSIMAGIYLSSICSCEYFLPISYGLKIWGSSIIIIVTTSLEIADSFTSYLKDLYGDLIKNRLGKHDQKITDTVIKRLKSNNSYNI